MSRLQGATAQPIREIKVSEFDDAELDDWLRAFGLSRGELAPALLTLIRIPRFAELAISLRHRLENEESLTVARLVLEDWRSRLEQRGGTLHITDDGLLNFVAGLANEVLADQDFSISLKDIHGRLSADSGYDLNHYRSAISDITEGLWLEASSVPYKYKVSQNLLPFVIGIDLENIIAAQNDESEIKETIGKYHEQLGGADEAVAIIRAATAIAFIRGKATATAKRILLESWLGFQNFNSTDFAEMWPLISLDPILFCDFAEDHFSVNPVGSGEGEILAKGLANGAKWPQVMDILLARLPHWVAEFGLDPVQWRFGKSIEVDKERTQQTKEWLNQWRNAQQTYHFDIQGHMRCSTDKGQLTAAAFSIISFLPRAPFIETFMSFAVAQAIMGETREDKVFAWLLRENGEDHEQVEDAILQEVALLKEIGSAVALNTGVILIDALATTRAHPWRPTRSKHSKQIFRSRAGTPTLNKNGLIFWSGGAKAADIEPLARTRQLVSFATDPAATLSKIDKFRLVSSAKGIDGTTRISDRYLTDNESEAIVFARWAATSLADLIRAVYFNLPERKFDSSGFVIHHLSRSLLVLHDKERKQLRSRGLKVLNEQKASQSETTRDEVLFCQNMILAGIAGQSSSVQLDTLHKLLPVFAFSTDLALFLAPPSNKDLQKVLNWLAQTTDLQEILSWLRYLQNVSLEQLPKNSCALLNLTDHKDKTVRGATLQILSNIADDKIGKAFVDGGWSFEDGQDRLEAIYGTWLLAKFSSTVPFSTIRMRIMPEGLPHLVEIRGCKKSEVRIVFEYIDKLLDDRLKPNQKSQSFYGLRLEAKNVWLKVVCLDDGVITQKLVQAARSRVLRGFFSPIPVYDLLRATFKTHPKEGVEIWKLVFEQNRSSGIIDRDINGLPFEISGQGELVVLRQQSLECAHTDSDLANIAYLALQGGHEDWLIQCIIEKLAADNAGQIARALTLAGYLNNSQQAEEVWARHIEPLVLSRWLEGVRHRAREAYYSNARALHWFAAFLNSTDAVEAYGLYRLFESCIDQRHTLWGNGMLTARRENMPSPWLEHIDAMRNARRSQVDKVANKRKRTLYHHPTVPYLSPWF